MVGLAVSGPATLVFGRLIVSSTVLVGSLVLVSILWVMWMASVSGRTVDGRGPMTIGPLAVRSVKTFGQSP